jgi:hypothetical protein
MVATLLCLFAALTSYYCVRRSISLGLIAVLLWGYMYGILRANFLAPLAHFIFDAGMAAFYLGYGWKLMREERTRVSRAKAWFSVLAGWVCVMALMPFQHPLITLVGLRGNIFFLPLLLVGARLKTPDLRILVRGIALLNLLAVTFGAAEYLLGVPKFYPENVVTQIIYNSNDVAGHQYLRIPSTFTMAHAYAGTMVATLPFLVGGWAYPDKRNARGVRMNAFWKLLLLAGIAAALMGVLMASTRINVVAAGVLLLAAVLTGGIKGKSRVALMMLMGVIAMIAVSNDRFSRFKSLSDQGAVMDRVGGSVNRTFLEIAEQYPMGNGLGGGGTSVPYFLAGLINKPISMESEYGRILLEQGLPGLAIWAAFIVSLVFASHAFAPGPWRSGRILGWLSCTVSLGLAFLGTGLMTSIPATVFLMLEAGWVLVYPAPEQDDLQPRDDFRSAEVPLPTEQWTEKQPNLLYPPAFCLEADREFAQ